MGPLGQPVHLTVLQQFHNQAICILCLAERGKGNYVNVVSTWKCLLALLGLKCLRKKKKTH